MPSTGEFVRTRRYRSHLPDPGDPDSHLHDTLCRVLERAQDDLGEETGRPTDAYSYGLERITGNEELDITFRHTDIVPATPCD